MFIFIENWNGKHIPVVLSKNCRPFLVDYMDNLIMLPKKSDTYIAKKLYPSNRSRSFKPADYNELKAKTGFYCELQSLQSEDAITWSIFGCLSHLPKTKSTEFLRCVLQAAGIESHSDEYSIDLWRRVKHPETGMAVNGPQIDFLIEGDDAVIIGESKWGSGVDTRQGVNRDKHQLQLRIEYLQKYGEIDYPQKRSRKVLLIGNEKFLDGNFEFISLDKICRQMNHPLGSELIKYYEWKKKYLS
jgi:uncharacterized protein YlbG (UPF0298 family)